MPYEITETGKQKRGFASMSPEKKREIARLGGMASHGGGRKPKPKETDDASA